MVIVAVYDLGLLGANSHEVSHQHVKRVGVLRFGDIFGFVIEVGQQFFVRLQAYVLNPCGKARE